MSFRGDSRGILSRLIGIILNHTKNLVLSKRSADSLGMTLRIRFLSSLEMTHKTQSTLVTLSLEDEGEVRGVV